MKKYAAMLIVLSSFLLSCKDDLRIRTYGIAALSEDAAFKIKSPANLATREPYLLEWTELSPTASYDVMVATDRECLKEVVSKKRIADLKLIIDFLKDGTYYLCVSSTVLSKTVKAINNGVFLGVDTSVPQVSIPTTILSYHNAFDPALTIDDLTLTTITWEQISGPGKVSFGNAASLHPQVTADTDGIYAIRATITDQAGNRMEQIYQFNWDTIGPNVSVGPTIITASPRATVVTHDSSVVRSQWSFSGGPADGALIFTPSGDPRAPLISATKEGTYTAIITVWDATDNDTSATLTFIWDETPPVFTSVLLAGPALDLVVDTAERGVSSALLGTLVASGYDAIAYKLTLAAASCQQISDYETAAPKSDSASFGVAGLYKICIQLSEASGLVSYGQSPSFTLDAIVLTSLLGANGASDTFINDSEKASNAVAWTLNASGQSATAFTIALDDTAGALVCNASQSYTQTTIPAISSLATDGPYAICVRLADASGAFIYGKSQQVVRDTIAPVFTSLALSNAASDGYINDSEKLLVNPMWALTASGQNATQYSTALSDTAGAQICDSGDAYGQASIAAPSFLSSDGAYALCVRLSDAAGNATYGKSDQVVRDTIFPVFTALAAANEALDGFIKSGEEASTAAAYALSASGQSAESYTVALDDSVPITCNSGKTYGNATIPLINSLTPDGTYAVCAKLVDAAGNASYGKSVQIVRDIVAPTFTSLNLAAEAADGYIANGERNASNAAWTLSASGHTAASYTVALDDSGGAVLCDAAKTYAGSIPLISSIVTDGPWAACVKLVDAAGNTAYGKSQQLIRDTTAPGVPGSFTATGGDRLVDLNWTASTGSPTAYLLVRGPVGSAPSFVPSDGTTYSVGAQGSDHIVSIGSATLKLDSPLSLGSVYNYKVYPYDLAVNYGTAAAATATTLTPCPAQFVFVAGDPDFGTTDFCAMKYEAKDNSGVASSQVTSLPWTSIDQMTPKTECGQLGQGYLLTSNDQWMTIASQIASIPTNWTGGSVASGSLIKGHSDNSPSAACAASSDDTLYYVEGSCSVSNTGDTIDQRRTHNLSDGEVIWDVSGNVLEWVDFFNRWDKAGALAGDLEYSAIAASGRMTKRSLVPTHGLKSYWLDAWDSDEGVGIYHPGLNDVGGAMQRGSSFAGSTFAGLFNASLDQDWTYTNANTGFRCTKSLADPDPASLSLAAGNSQITASWTAVGGASGYVLVRGAAGSMPTFQPVNGTTYSASSQGADTIVYAGAALTAIDAGLDNGRAYSYALYSWTGSHVYASPVRSKDTPIGCPTGYVFVPGDADYASDDFCVMKYEAKAQNDAAASIPELNPRFVWFKDALYQCASLGPGYQLIDNSQYMTLANDAAARGSNWSSGTVGTGKLYTGHSDDNPELECVASSDDSKAYVERTCNPIASGQGEDDQVTQRRTLQLNNGQVIWDLSGNVWEWVNFYNASDKPMAMNQWYEYTAVTGTSTTPLKNLIPTTAIKPSYWVDTWNSSKGIGQFYPKANGIGGAMLRGGFYGDDAYAGLFATSLTDGPDDGNWGFRCAVRGQTPNTPQSFVSDAAGGSIALSWDKGGSTTAGYLLVKGPDSYLPSFQPANGISYTVSTQGNDRILSVGLGKWMLDTASLTSLGSYSYRVYAYDSAFNYSSAAVQLAHNSPCDSSPGFGLILGDADYSTKDFCLLEREAKNNGSNALASVNSNLSLPWVNITQEGAGAQCESLGPSFHLVTNEEWMTVASDLPRVSDNWTTGVVGSGSLIRGHTDGSPATLCGDSNDDTLAFVQGSCTNVSSGGGLDQKRVFRASSTAILWDFSGNAGEWVNAVNENAKPSPVTGADAEYTGVTGTASMPLTYLIPTNAVKNYFSDAWTSAQGIGMYLSDGQGSGGGLIRGGTVADATAGGIYRVNLSVAPNASNATTSFRCARSLPDRDTATLTLLPGTTSISASWAGTGASGYLLVRGTAGGVEPSFVPRDGTSYTTGTQGNSTVLSADASLSFSDSGLAASTQFHYALFSYDASYHYRLLARDAESTVSCPANWVSIPGDKDYGTQDFCAMKYEAKDDGSGNAVSQVASAPYAFISQRMARTKCSALGLGYDLISNPEWMTMGSNIAALGGNWTGAAVGTGRLFVGHSDDSPSQPCAASANDTLAFVEGTCTPAASGGSADQKRTFSLSNGAVIWDASGNMAEHVSYVNVNDRFGNTFADFEYPALGSTSTLPVHFLIPTHAVKNFWMDTWNSNQGIGMNTAEANGVGGALIRGGAWPFTSTYSGVFASGFADPSDYAGADYAGFRCVWRR